MIDGLAHAGAAEQTGLTALDERLDQVDGLDARLEDLGLRDQLVDTREPDGGWACSRVTSGMGFSSTGSPMHVPDAAQGLLAHGHHDGMARVRNLQAADQTVGRAHGDGADDVARAGASSTSSTTCRSPACGLGVNRQRVVDRRQLIRGELNVNNRSRRYARCDPWRLCWPRPPP